MISKYFKFKNKETETAIINILNTHEGILEKDLNEYLANCHMKVKVDLLIEAEDLITKFMHKNAHLSLSDLKGVLDLAMAGIIHASCKKGDSVISLIK